MTDDAPGRRLAIWANWIMPPLMLATIISVESTSQVRFDTWALSETHGTVLVWFYGAGLVIMGVGFHRPDTIGANPHFLAAVGALGAVIFAARTLGFVELGLSQDRTFFGTRGLFGNIIERALLFAMVVFWHGFQAWQIGLRDNTNGDDDK